MKKKVLLLPLIALLLFIFTQPTESFAATPKKVNFLATTVKNVELKEKPSQKSKTVSKVKKATVIKIVAFEVSHKYVLVQAQGKKGFVPRNNLKITKPKDKWLGRFEYGASGKIVNQITVHSIVPKKEISFSVTDADTRYNLPDTLEFYKAKYVNGSYVFEKDKEKFKLKLKDNRIYTYDLTKRIEDHKTHMYFTENDSKFAYKRILP